MDGNKSTNGNYGGLKPLEVPTRPKRRTASNGGALDNATSTSNGGSDTTSSFDPRRGRSADGARTHHRRVSNMANDGGDTEVVQSTGTKISPTSPVHRTGYHSQGEAEADRTPSDFDIGEFYGQPSISPRRSTEAGAVVAASAAVAANPMHPTRPGRISNFLSRLTFTHAGKHNAQVIPEPLPSAEPTPSKPVSISGWSKISTSWTAGRLSGYDWKDSFSSKQEMMEDDLKSSKPSSPAGIMIQQKKRCRCLNDHTMIGMAVVGLALIFLLLIIVVPAVIVTKRNQEAAAIAEEQVRYYSSISAAKTKTPTVVATTPKPIIKTTARPTTTATTTRTKTTTKPPRTLPNAWDPLPWVEPLGPAKIRTYCVEAGTMALTFDDGPYDYTDDVLNVLAQEGVPATFFINGRNFGDITWDKYANMVKRMTSEGHLVASHTHRHWTLRGLSDDDIKYQLLTLENHTYYQFGFRTRFLRPPSGRYDDNVLRVAGELGYSDIVLWNADPEDWSTPDDPDGTFNRVRSVVNGHDIKKEGVIVLLHDVHENTAKIVARRVIQWAKDQGWRFVTMDACLGEWGKAYKPGELPIGNYYTYDS